MAEASSISYLIQKTFLEGTEAGEQEGCQENWNVPLSSGVQGDKIWEGKPSSSKVQSGALHIVGPYKQYSV